MDDRKPLGCCYGCVLLLVVWVVLVLDYLLGGWSYVMGEDDE